MKQVTFKQWAADNRGIPETVTGAVIRQCGGWRSFTESAPDVVAHGAAGGFSGFAYYSETVPFGRRLRDALLSMLRSLADDLGESGELEVLAGFQCLSFNGAGTSQSELARALYQPGAEDAAQVFNALAWYALEETARAYVDAQEESQA